MECCDQSWNFTNFAPNFYHFFWVTAKKLSRNLESPHFLTCSTKCRVWKIGKRHGHGKSRNGHGKVMEKYFVNGLWEPCMYIYKVHIDTAI